MCAQRDLTVAETDRNGAESFLHGDGISGLQLSEALLVLQQHLQRLVHRIVDLVRPAQGFPPFQPDKHRSIDTVLSTAW